MDFLFSQKIISWKKMENFEAVKRIPIIFSEGYNSIIKLIML